MNTAILRLSDEFITDFHGFLPYVLTSNNINFSGCKFLRGVGFTELKVHSNCHFKQGFGEYSLKFELGEDGFMFLKDVHLEKLL